MTYTERKAVKVRIYGRVQGVWYRRWTEQEANKLGLYGWVRNRVDGTVEALFVGSPDTVEAMLVACHNGPPAAVVEKIDVDSAKGITPNRFEVKPTV